MPLNPTVLQSALEVLFADPPPTALECAQAWADALGDYAADIIPASLTVAAAAAAMVAPLQAAFESAAAAPDVDAAFTTFAASVAAGMLPTFTGLPPPASIGFASLLGNPQDTHASAAAFFAPFIDTWFRTGIGTLVAPPNTAALWS